MPRMTRRNAAAKHQPSHDDGNVVDDVVGSDPLWAVVVGAVEGGDLSLFFLPWAAMSVRAGPSIELADYDPRPTLPACEQASSGLLLFLRLLY